LGAADLEHVGEFDCLGLQRIGKLSQGLRKGRPARSRQAAVPSDRHHSLIGPFDVVDRMQKLYLAAPVAQ